jgi:cell division protein FtsB
MNRLINPADAAAASGHAARCTEPPLTRADAEPRKSRKSWIWLSAVLAVVAVGLLIWALTIESDLDNVNQELAAANEELDGTKKRLDATKQNVEDLQAQADKGVGTGAAVVGATALYREFSHQLSATHDDLASTQQDLEEAERCRPSRSPPRAVIAESCSRTTCKDELAAA